LYYGIFSAIVLVFFGGTSIIGNIIEGMKETNIFITIIVTCFAGTIIFDLLFMFIYFLAKILDRNIAATQERVWWEPILARVRIRYPIIFYANIISTIVIYISGIIGTLQWIIKNQGDVVRWLNYNLLLDFTHAPLLFYMTLIFIGFNITFVFAYVLSKIADINIGRVIEIKYREDYTIEKDEFTSVVIVDYNYDNPKKMPYKWMSYPYVWVRKIISTIYVFIHNVISRVVCRYPYWFLFNIIVIGLLIWMNSK